MKSAGQLAVEFAKQHTKYRLPAKFHFSKARLRLKGGKYCHYTGKGWQATVLMQWLGWLVAGHEDLPLDDNIKCLIWTGNNFIGMLYESKGSNGHFLTEQQAKQIQAIGGVFVTTYLNLNRAYQGWCTYKLWNCRPKLHLLVHLLDGVAKLKNPLAGVTWLDEGWLKTIMAIARKTHVKCTQSSTLKRYLAGVPAEQL